MLNVVNASDNSTIDDVENQTVINNTTVKQATTFKASDYTAYVGVKNNYKVVLNANNKPLSKKIVNFSVNGKTFSKKTNSKGEASLDLNLKKGTYTIKYSYGGDNTTLKSSGQSKIVVKSISKTTIKKANNIVYKHLKSDKFKIQLLDIRSNPIKNAKITFKVNKKKYIRKTNTKGIATLNIKLKSGDYKVNVLFSKTSKFKKSSKTFKIKVKSKNARNNGFWLFARDMGKVNFKTLQKYGIKHIFLNEKALENIGKSGVENFIKKANSYKIKVHIWMQVFYSAKGWSNPVKNGKVNYDLINSKVKIAKSYAKLKGVGGVNFDYIRYPGTAYKYHNAVKAINYFIKKASSSIHAVNKKIIVSGTVMPEPSSMKKYYGQDIPTMGKYLDVIVPMVYKGNYNAGHSWIKFVCKSFIKQSKHAKIWCGLQGYKGDNSLKKLSSNELMGDADTAASTGVYGIMLFRFELFNYINFNKV